MRKQRMLYKFAVFIITLILGVAFVPTLLSAEVSYAANDFYSDEYKSSIFYTRLCEVELTGDMRVDIVNVARSQIGYHEGNSAAGYDGMSVDADKDYTEYGWWYYNKVTKAWGELYHQSWCAMFVSWCAREANIPTSIIANSINALPNNINGRYAAGRYFNVESKTPESGYVPQSGDLIFFDWTQKNSRWSHVGIVASVIDDGADLVDGKVIITIEGATSDKVAVRAYAADDPTIRAYGVPNYTTDSHVHTWETVKKTSCTENGTKVCKSCGATDIIERLEHQYWKWSDVITESDKAKQKHIDKAATCTTDGEKSFHCIRCNARSGIEKIKAIGHAYKLVKTEASTCASKGYKYYVCNNDSSHNYKEEIEKLPHTESGWLLDSEATYLQDGKRYTECTVCHDVIKTEAIPKLTDTLPPPVILTCVNV